MSVIATAVKHLMAAGVTGDALLAAIEEMEAQVRAEPKPRSAGAIRQERYRRNKASQSVTVTESVTPSLSRPLPPQTPLTPTHTHPEYNTRARKGPVPAKPEGVSSQTWADFLALRKQKRADLSQTALAEIEREAVKAGWSLESALAECVARGWQAFKADWVEGKGAGPPGNSGSLVSGFLTTRKSQTA